MQKEVVKDVKAESALEYAAAIRPNKKNAEVAIHISGLFLLLFHAG